MNFRYFSFTIYIVLLVSCDALAERSRSEAFLDQFEAGDLNEQQVIQEINMPDEGGQTPLYRAVRSKEPDFALIKSLLDAGADPFARQSDENYPVRSILSLNNDELFESAVCGSQKSVSSRFAPMEGNSLYLHYPTIVHDAAVRGSAADIRSLAKCDFELDVENIYGQTPLVLAAAVNIEAFDALIESGADPSYSPKVLEAICGRIASMPLPNRRESFLKSLRRAGTNCQ